MRLLTIVICLASFACASFNCTDTDGQEIRKAIRDYKTDRVFDYQPDDPSYRGKMFNIQTKHYGKFYNCDGEEAKRYSPYICWKPHTDKDFPPHVRMIDCIRNDLAEVRQRIADGACCQDSCECRECQSVQPQNGCQQCASQGSYEYSAKSTKSLFQHSAGSETIERPEFENTPAVHTNLAGKYGLVRGKIIDPVVAQPRQADNVASKSAIDLLRRR